MTDIDTLAATVRKALDNPGQWSRYPNAKTALAALVEHARSLARKAEAYDRARASVKIEGATRAEYVLRAEAAEARADRYEKALERIAAYETANREENGQHSIARAALAGEDA